MSGDPRSIVTPDAFSVSPDLLGTPLARPGRRLAALMVDLVLIGFLQLLGWRVLGGLIALTLFRLATRRTDGRGSGRVRGLALGCAGVAIGVVAVGATFLPSLIRFANDADQLLDLRLEEEALSDDANPGSDAAPDLGAVLESARETLGPDPGADADSLELLRHELAEVRLQNSLLNAEKRASADQLDDMQERLENAQGSTLFAWIRDAADEAGLVMGWGTIYLTLFLALWGGRTPGKRLLGLRVVRLNGQPLGLFMSLERAGGYAAGLATGLLGFAQVWWDPNRQAIHDKIAETVVIREGVARIAYSQSPQRGSSDERNQQP